jgi:hypothetical protein
VIKTGAKDFTVDGRGELSGQGVTVLHRRVATENGFFGRDLYAVSSADHYIADKTYLAGFPDKQGRIGSTGQCALFDSDILGTPCGRSERGSIRIGRFGCSKERSRHFHAIRPVHLMLLDATISAKTGKEKYRYNC